MPNAYLIGSYNYNYLHDNILFYKNIMLDAKPILSVLFFSKELPELRVQIIGYLLKSQIKSNFVGGVIVNFYSYQLWA